MVIERRTALSISVGVLAATIACEQHFSAHPPRLASESSPSSSGNTFDALFAPAAVDAGSAAQASIPMMTVARCSSSTEACASDGDLSATENYRVVFGSGRGTIRSREQATAELYKELRDRTKAGQRLHAVTASRGDAGAAEIRSVPSAVKSDPSVGDEPLILLAVRLMDFVDSAGEVSLDVVHDSGNNGCALSWGGGADGGAPHCLLEEHQKPVKPTGRGGFEF
jgi:hypothetical protein